MTDDPAALAAEIARHRPSTWGSEELCLECDQPWKPCLVRRLADARSDLLEQLADWMIGVRSDGLRVCFGCQASGRTAIAHASDCVLHAGRALAPADGEDAE